MLFLLKAITRILCPIVNNAVLVFACALSAVGCFFRVKSSSKKQEEKKASYTKEHKCACLALDKEESVVGYVVPVCRSR